jgi:hypothetical protein
MKCAARLGLISSPVRGVLENPSPCYQAFWNKGKPVIGVGVNFLSTTKNIDDWKAENFA